MFDVDLAAAIGQLDMGTWMKQRTASKHSQEPYIPKTTTMNERTDVIQIMDKYCIANEWNKGIRQFGRKHLIVTQWTFEFVMFPRKIDLFIIDLREIISNYFFMFKALESPWKLTLINSFTVFFRILQVGFCQNNTDETLKVEIKLVSSEK